MITSSFGVITLRVVIMSGVSEHIVGSIFCTDENHRPGTWKQQCVPKLRRTHITGQIITQKLEFIIQNAAKSRILAVYDSDVQIRMNLIKTQRRATA